MSFSRALNPVRGLRFHLLDWPRSQRSGALIALPVFSSAAGAARSPLILRLLQTAAALLSLFVPAACGYTAAYAPGGAGYGLEGSILVQEPSDHDEFIFVTRLEERLGRPQGARYQLTYSIETGTESAGRTAEQEITRFIVNGVARFQITDAVAGRVVHSGTVENLTSYSAAIPFASSRAATRDAIERLMVILADQVVVRILASYRDWEE